jgi:hypothetical protein
MCRIANDDSSPRMSPRAVRQHRQHDEENEPNQRTTKLKKEAPMKTKKTNEEAAAPQAKGKLPGKKLQITVRDLSPKEDAKGGAASNFCGQGCSCWVCNQ